MKKLLKNHIRELKLYLYRFLTFLNILNSIIILFVNKLKEL